MTYAVEKRNRKWCIVDADKQRVVTIEPVAGSDDEDCKALAIHLASFMNQMLHWG